jgi:hypothetical protein
VTGSYWFRMTNGEDFTRSLTWFQDEEMEHPVNLTGWTAAFHVDLGGATILTVTTTPGDPGAITLGGPAGTIGIHIARAAFAAATAFSVATYRLLLTAPSGDTLCLLDGQFGKDVPA